MKEKIWKSVLVASAVAVLSVVGLASYTIVHYLYTSPRFEIRKVSVDGLKRVEQAQVLAQAALPPSANVFSADLKGIRERVEQLKWVRFASVQRILPDTLAIRVVEREPAGLARIRGEIWQFDSDAILLRPDEELSSFPVLDGLHPDPDDPAGNRRKVELYLKVMKDLHGQGELSEIHINDAEEVAVVPLSEPLLVNLGAEDFRSKWALFLQLKTQIERAYPQAVQVDFRFKDQVILKIQPDAPDEEQEKVVWDAEKKSL